MHPAPARDLSPRKRVAAFAAAACLSITMIGSAQVPPSAILLRAGDDLQSAIDRARPGDTISLEPGATFVGNFVLPAKSGGSYITIRSSTPDDALPAAHQRMLPVYEAALAKLRSPNSLPVVQTAPGAHHWRLQFLEIGPNATAANDLIRFGDGSSQQTSLKGVPYELDIDRCYIHGHPVVGQKRGIALNSASTRIINSYLSDFKLVGQDTQAIAGWNGPGPYLIENNYIEAAGENVLFGGADPAIPDLVPTDITFRDNHLSKPPGWRHERWQVKNLFELKNATRVLVEYNLFEHNWQAAQSGPAILFTPRNQDGGSPWSVVSNVMFRANVVRNVAAAFSILGFDDRHPSQQTSNILLHHNLITDVDAERWGGNGAFLLIGDAVRRIDVNHNTVMQTGNAVSVYGRPTTGFSFRNNLIRHNAFGIKGDSRATGNDTIQTFFPGAVVANNAFRGGVPDQYPANNFFPSHAVWVAQFRDYERSDFALTPTSQFRRAGTNGSDLGADPELVRRALAAPEGRQFSPRSHRDR